MGYLLSAECRCGFQGEAQFGTGQSDHPLKLDVPCFCEACKSLITVDVRARDRRCPKCKMSEPSRFDDSRMHDGVALRELASCLDGDSPVTLLDANYLCPGCRQYSLRFHIEALFD